MARRSSSLKSYQFGRHSMAKKARKAKRKYFKGAAKTVKKEMRRYK
jgi:hypothetical protein